MHPEPPHARTRNVSALQIPTPLLVPSFSSRRFPHVAAIHRDMAHKLYGVSLISTWDLAQGHLPMSATLATDVVIMDSGGYEEHADLVAEPVSGPSGSASSWSVHRYREILATIGDAANALIVSYDRPAPLQEQIAGALRDIACAPGAAADFLLKPESSGEIVNVARVMQYPNELRQFDAIGITAREIGASLIERCRTIVTLRNILEDSGLSVPIHVFGALSPVEVLPYFLCGADVFDGLDWLRFSFRQTATVTMEEVALEDMRWGQNDYALHLDEWTNNVTFLYRMQESMRCYARTGALSDLCRDFPLAARAAHVAELSGAEIRRGGPSDGR